MRLPIKEDKVGNAVWVSKRELKLRYRVGIERLKAFFENLENGKLTGTVCKNCGERHFPPQMDCAKCGSSGMEWYEVSKRGRIITYTKIFVRPASFHNSPDYIVGVAKMNDGTNVIAWVDADLETIKPGLEVELVVNAEMEPVYILRRVIADE